MRFGRGGVLAFAMSWAVSSAGLSLAAAAVPLPPPDPAELESVMLGLVNLERTAAGLAPLCVHPWARRAAAEHAARMAAAGDIWHNDEYPVLGGREMGADLVGENVGVGYTPEALHAAFMASATHRPNIMSGDFTHVGIGFARGTTGLVYVTQDFARLPGAAPAARVAGSPAPAGPPPPPEAPVRMPSAQPAGAPPAAEAPPPAESSPGPPPAGAGRSAAAVAAVSKEHPDREPSATVALLAVLGLMGAASLAATNRGRCPA